MGKKFCATLLQNQDWYQKVCQQGKFLPEMDSVRDNVFWERCMNYTSPVQELMVLERMSAISPNCKAATLEHLGASYHKSVIIQGLAFYIQTTKTINLAHLPPEKLFAFLDAIQRPISDVAASLQKLRNEDLKEGKAVVDKFFVTPYAVQVLTRVTSLLNAQVEKIPANYENWILNRNIPRIKQTCFDESVHTSIVAYMEAYSRGLNITDQLFSSLAECQVIQAAHISKLKIAQQSLKALKQYSCNVHGLNVVINRMPGEGRRERSAMLREYFGVISNRFFLWGSRSKNLKGNFTS